MKLRSSCILVQILSIAAMLTQLEMLRNFKKKKINDDKTGSITEKSVLKSTAVHTLTNKLPDSLFPGIFFLQNNYNVFFFKFTGIPWTNF